MPVKIDNVLSWGSDVEQSTIDQALLASKMPFVSGHVALMADCHIGKGSTIGSVIPTQGAILPAAVGVDQGCGVCAMSTDVAASQLPDTLEPLLSMIAKTIPSGVGQGHKFAIDWDQERHTRKVPEYKGSSKLTGKQVNKITEQFGTLGSGNHFVEVCLDEDDMVWLLLHSGSRGIGNQLATDHINLAKGMMKKLFIRLEDPDLAYLVEDSPEFNAYIQDLLWAQDYAFANREQMMNAAMQQFVEFLGRPVVAGKMINNHHNYTTRENHMGKNMWITRKGAIRARVGDYGVIPGSMGTSSFIIEGLGNPASYNSSSHGAGRRMSRGQARRELTPESLTEVMGNRVWNGNTGEDSWAKHDAKALVDEHPAAYKDVNQVMADQQDLVKIIHTLHSVLNYKGT